MSDHRAIAHLEEQLGPARWQALINPANTGKTKEFCDRELNVIPTEITIGGRTYEILSFLRGEKSVKGDVMVKRAKEMHAHLGKDDREHLLKHQDEIPAILRGEVVFVFTDDRHPDDQQDQQHLVSRVYCADWRGVRWITDWDWLDDGFNSIYQVLRRKSA